uniref:TIP41-like protein n=1 Tax=Hemiselmis andersenii TaxID=464988 RepID=A0A6U4NIQ6_HEMAN|mmetsp:Transcript_3674/g.8404  ORF Transcript_3674/g.8404 Transcript_3674/m.8404 type:complete len:298 (+) Transcript_3674:63-956(+)
MTHQVQEGNQQTGTWNRPSTPMYEKVGDEWVSKGWNELEHKGWLFKAISRPAVDTQQADRAQLAQEMSGLGQVPPPSTVYPGNSIQAVNHETGVSLNFDSPGAINAWAAEIQKQGHSSWLSPCPFNGALETDRQKFRAMLNAAKRIEATEFARPVPTRMRIPMDLLTKKEHIHFYDAVPLAGDGAPGHGQSEVSAKIRVMEDFFLVLLRCFICTDQGVFLRDVRWFHRFGDKFVLQDEEVRQAPLAELERAVAQQRPVSASVTEEARHHASYFTNPEQVWEALPPKLISNNLIAIRF